MARYLPDPIAVQSRADPSTPLRVVMELIAALDVADSFPDAVTAYRRAEALHDAERQEPGNLTDRYREVLAALSAGTVDIAEARAAITDTSHLSNTGASRAALGTARAEALRTAWRTFTTMGENGVIAVLGPIADDAVRESVTLASGLDDRVNDYPIAALVSKKTAETWVRLGVLYAQWVMVHDIMDTLRVEDALPVVSDTAWPRYLHPEEHRYRYPESSLDVPTMPTERFLARVVAAGAVPGVYTTTDVRSHRSDDRESPTDSVAA